MNLNEKAIANQYPINTKFGMWAVEITEYISRTWFKKGYELCQREYEEKLENKYYFITYQEIGKFGTVTLINKVIDGSPLKFINNLTLKNPSCIYTMVNTCEITKSEFNKYHYVKI